MHNPLFLNLYREIINFVFLKTFLSVKARPVIRCHILMVWLDIFMKKLLSKKGAEIRKTARTAKYPGTCESWKLLTPPPGPEGTSRGSGQKLLTERPTSPKPLLRQRWQPRINCGPLGGKAREIDPSSSS